MDITLYCPDRHMRYDGTTAERSGVGGGVTARIRIAAALARRGHAVTVVCNCVREMKAQGVRYLPLDGVRRIDTGILILHSTGDRLDLRPVLELEVRARLRLVFVGGPPAPKGMHEVGMDYLCVPSNFIRRQAVAEWEVAPGRVFVSHHGVVEEYFRHTWWHQRPHKDPRRIVYGSHPSKGLEAAIALLRLLRERDGRFELHVYGGNRLWGGAENLEGVSEPGMAYHGLMGQRALARELQGGGFAFHLQTRLEPFGIALVEAMAAGCIPLASPVGAHPEIVRHGHNGFLLAGDPADGETIRRAAEVVLRVAGEPDFADYLRRNARAAPLTWDQVAAAWERHWTWALGEGRMESRDRPPEGAGACPECGGAWLLAADGYHCTGCGNYSRDGLPH